jgi:hypothetical protein
MLRRLHGTTVGNVRPEPSVAQPALPEDPAAQAAGLQRIGATYHSEADRLAPANVEALRRLEPG